MWVVSDMRGAFARFPREYWFLWFGLLVNRAGAFVMPFLTLYLARERGMEGERAGLFVSVFGVGAMISTLLGGHLADHWGRKPTMLLSLVGGAACLSALLLAPGNTALGLAIFLFGLVAELYRPAVSATIADLVPAEERAAAYSYLYWAHNLGFAIAPMVASVLMGVAGYTALFIGDGATMVLAAVIIALFVPDSLPKALEGQTPSKGSVWSDRVALAFLAASFLVGFLLLQTITAIPTLLAGSGIDEVTYGRVIALNGVLIVCFQPAVTRWLRDFDFTRTLAVGMILLGVGLALHGFARDALEHSLAIVVWTIGETAVVPASGAVIANLAPRDQRGRYQGAYSMSWSVAWLVAPAFGSFVLARGGAMAWAALAALVGVLGGVTHWISGPARRAREAAIREANLGVASSG
jgi:MFS family permease